MTPVEIMAFIVALFAIIKLIMLLANPTAWMRLPKILNAQPIVSMLVSLVLAAIVLYYLLAELTIIQIFACLLFVMLLMMSAFSPFSKDLVDMAAKMLNKSTLKKAWLPSLVWVLLVVWVLYALFV
jgi:hypothetical protein